jgi:hypothetical protein
MPTSEKRYPAYDICQCDENFFTTMRFDSMFSKSVQPGYREKHPFFDNIATPQKTILSGEAEAKWLLINL